MKKLFYIFCMVLGISAMVGCGNSSATSNLENDSVLVDSDSIALVDTAAIDSVVCPD